MSAINGYGYYYLKTLIEEVPESQAILVGVIDPEAQKSGHYPWIIQRNVPVFSRMEDFFRAGLSVDLTVISSPPQYHVSQAIIALSNGSNVLVDKPLGVNIKSVRELIVAAEKFQRWVEVGYQWTFSNAIQSLKKDILQGRYGRPTRFKTICLWPRDYNYYNRNSWAGRIVDPLGQAVLDSPANNACAHFLYNLFYLLGDEMGTSAMPQQIDSERYRAYRIENYDTITLRARTKKGTEVLFFASHVTENDRNPEFYLEFSKGVVQFGGTHSQIIGEFNEGNEINYGSPEDDHQFKKLFDAIKRVREPGPTICPPEAAIAQTICINQVQESKNPIINFPEELIIKKDDRRWVDGLGERMGKAYENNSMISETI